MFDKSFYDLAFGVDPGGARKDAHFISATLDEVKRELASELSQGINLYLLCWYGAHLTLDVYQQGELTESIDLHPFITISVEGHPDITFTGPGEPVGYDFRGDKGDTEDDEDDKDDEDEDFEDEDDEEEEDEEDNLADRMFADDLDDSVKVSVDWDRIPVPSLIGEVAGPDDEAVLLTGDHLAEYGYQDFEE
ncbi:hypothetical protein [Streptomyces milbemycinicus]|uniref:hypothetical protein n=1 Tax=Streptomyces milbemycinicus TaxID=476552 RepID=UPI0033C96E26